MATGDGEVTSEGKIIPMNVKTGDKVLWKMVRNRGKAGR